VSGGCRNGMAVLNYKYSATTIGRESTYFSSREIFVQTFVRCKGPCYSPPGMGCFYGHEMLPSRACPFPHPYRTVRLGAGSRHHMVQFFFRRGFSLSRVCTINYRRGFGPGPGEHLVHSGRATPARSGLSAVCLRHPAASLWVS
jgi:hypothetical protein